MSRPSSGRRSSRSSFQSEDDDGPGAAGAGMSTPEVAFVIRSRTVTVVNPTPRPAAPLPPAAGVGFGAELDFSEAITEESLVRGVALPPQCHTLHCAYGCSAQAEVVAVVPSGRPLLGVEAAPCRFFACSFGGGGGGEGHTTIAYVVCPPPPPFAVSFPLQNVHGCGRGCYAWVRGPFAARPRLLRNTWACVSPIGSRGRRCVRHPQREACGQQDLASVVQLELTVDTTDQSVARIGEFCPALRELKLNDSVLQSIRDLGTGVRNLQVHPRRAHAHVRRSAVWARMRRMLARPRRCGLRRWRGCPGPSTARRDGYPSSLVAIQRTR
jgi:hypothetical protein